jgi:hypothetical protein
MSAFFRLVAGFLAPQSTAASGWSSNTMRGLAVSGAMARAAEQIQHERGRLDLRPARWTVDLCSASPMQPLTAIAEVLQESGRLMLVATELQHEGRTTARGTALFLKVAESPDNPVWESGRRWGPPPRALDPHLDDPTLYFSEGAGWSADQSERQDARRKRSWNWAIPVVEGEHITPFQAVASVADLASMVANWGERGIAHINADITVAIARMPESSDIGLAALERVESDGIAIGTAAMFDRRGTIGTVVVSALANARKVIDLRATTRLGLPR